MLVPEGRRWRSQLRQGARSHPSSHFILFGPSMAWTKPTTLGRAGSFTQFSRSKIQATASQPQPKTVFCRLPGPPSAGSVEATCWAAAWETHF